MTTITAPTRTPPTTSQGILPALLTATFMTTLDFFIVNVALPAMQHDLHASPAALQWVVVGFGLAFAAGLITGGGLGDIYGRRRLFGLGLALFTVASVLCGIAPTAGFLVGARVLQGVAAALLTPQVLAIMRTSIAPDKQAKAFARYGLTMGLGAVFGQLIGGLLIKADLFGLDWRMCFLINLPVGVFALAFLRQIPESRNPGTKLDPTGVVLITAALVALVLPLTEGQQQGWPLWTWLSLAGACALFVLFAMDQKRKTHPVIHLALFREKTFSTGLLAVQMFWMGQASFFVILALYLQLGQGLSALQSGAVFTAIGVGYLGSSTIADKLAARLGRQVISLGALAMACGLLLMWQAAGHHIGWLLPALAVDGIGMGMALAPLTTIALSRIRPEHAGAASGVLSTINQTGNALGVAVIGIAFYQAAGYTGGFRAGLIALIVIELMLAAITQLLPRR